jgi:photosystem II stability/assembly factor-like uncharacterized protein
MRNFILAFFLFSIFSCGKKKIAVDAIEVNTPTDLTLHKIEFFNQDIGFAVGGSQFYEACLLKTTDGGLTWQRIDLGFAPQKKAIHSIAISSTGKLMAVGFGGTIFLSNDTGRTFQYVQHNSWREFQDVSITESDTCAIVGGAGFEFGFVARMKNNGDGANRVQEEWKAEMCDIDMLQNKVGYIAGFGAILKTTDAGQTWYFTSAKNDNFKAMSWKNSNEGVAVGYAGSILKTSNGGDNWDKMRNGNSVFNKKYHFLNIAYDGLQTYIAVGESGLVYVSKDDGETWNEFAHFTKNDIRGVTFLNASTCFVVGENGMMFRMNL